MADKGFVLGGYDGVVEEVVDRTGVVHGDVVFQKFHLVEFGVRNNREQLAEVHKTELPHIQRNVLLLQQTKQKNNISPSQRKIRVQQAPLHIHQQLPELIAVHRPQDLHYHNVRPSIRTIPEPRHHLRKHSHRVQMLPVDKLEEFVHFHQVEEDQFLGEVLFGDREDEGEEAFVRVDLGDGGDDEFDEGRGEMGVRGEEVFEVLEDVGQL